jgi:hypothetical protein
MKEWVTLAVYFVGLLAAVFYHEKSPGYLRDWAILTLLLLLVP